MIPQPSQALTDLAIRLALQVAPNTTAPFYGADAGLIAQLMFTLGQEFERAVQARMQDIDDIKTLFASAPASDERRAYQLKQPASLHLNDVNALHDEGSRLLIELHAWAETNSEAVNAAICAYLRRHTERHKFDMP